MDGKNAKNRRLMSIIKDRYDELLRMMKTSDIDNTKLALTIIEQNRKKNDLPYIMMLYKNKGNTSSITWTDNAPKTMKVITPMNYSSYITVITSMCKSDLTDKSKMEGVEFVLNKLNEEILSAVQGTGYGYVKSIKTTCSNEQ
jgi:hypothetical protein